MTTVRARRMRLASILGLLMMLMSVTPMGIAAQSGITPGDDVAQIDPAATGPAIELLVGACPPDAPEDPSDLVPGCMQDGMANVNVQVTSTDPALGIDLPKTTEQPAVPGPGVINTGAIPVGEYKLTLDLPTDQNRFFFECRNRDTDAAVPVAPSPDGAANSFLVSTTEGAGDVVCSAFVTSTVVQPTIEITYRECARADIPGEGRTFEDLDPNCTTVSTNPPTFNVRDLNVAEQPVNEYQLNAEGKVSVTLTPGAFDFFTDLEMDQWGEYLFCEYEAQPRYEKDFDPNRGITTFTDLLPGEKITCDWFAVSAADEAVETPTSTEAAATEAPTEATETEVPATQAPEDDQAGNDPAPNQAGGPTITIDFNECARGDIPTEGRTFADLEAACVDAPAEPVTIAVNPTGDFQLDANGEVAIQTGTGDITLNSGKDMDSWGQYLFCEYEGQPQYQKQFNANGNVSFVDLESEQITCDWFAVQAPVEPPVETATATTVPSPTATAAPTDVPAAGGFNVRLVACESEESVGDTSSLDAFRTNCTTGIENMVLNLTNDTENLSQVTNPNGDASFANVPAGNWRMWSEIPLESATEYYFCADESGAYNAVQLSDRGAASFNEFDGQQINCEVYVVPTNLRGEVTGASVEVHLSNCPIDYAGSNYYNDCHANGISDIPFTLTGPNGEVTANTAVPRTPGPGIVTFTELPAGDYVLAGGPPQDFGTVYLYCSDPATGTQVTTAFEDGVGRFSVAENQSVVCDWYFTGENQGAPTPTPTTTPEAQKAEIFTTMFVCPDGTNVAGSTFAQLDDACGERVSDVPMTLQSPGGVPITANTGESGEGAIRFYDLVSGDYVLTPTLPAEYVSAAVYCDLDGGEVYQKALSNGATTFTDVEGELISCSWFLTSKPAPAPDPSQPTGSITIREMLCEGDRATIVDWERECLPGSSGVSFTITSSGGSASQTTTGETVTQTLTPNAEGVAVFSGLPNDYYAVEQSEGVWCRAKAERVDSQSRVIVANGGNTDLFLYQCNQDVGLPNTGSGPAASSPGNELMGSFALGAVALPLLAAAAWHIRRYQNAKVATIRVVNQVSYSRTDSGYRYH